MFLIVQACFPALSPKRAGESQTKIKRGEVMGSSHFNLLPVTLLYIALHKNENH